MTGNDRTKTKHAFSVIDFVIIVTVIALIVGVILRYDLLEKLFSRTEMTEITVAFTAEDISKEEAQVFLSEAEFYLDGREFGQLVSSQSLPHTSYVENALGVLVQIQNENRVDVSGSFLCKAVKSDSGYLLNGDTYIAAGSSFTLRSGPCEITVLILGVQDK